MAAVLPNILQTHDYQEIRNLCPMQLFKYSYFVMSSRVSNWPVFSINISTQHLMNMVNSKFSIFSCPVIVMCTVSDCGLWTYLTNSRQ